MIMRLPVSRVMRPTMLVLVSVLSMAVPAVAQEWTEYQNVQDGFKVDFPGQPKVTEGTWKSEHGFMLPQRIYSNVSHRLTVTNFSGKSNESSDHLL
jgi:hypothetical protein